VGAEAALACSAHEGRPRETHSPKMRPCSSGAQRIGTGGDIEGSWADTPRTRDEVRVGRSRAIRHGKRMLRPVPNHVFRAGKFRDSLTSTKCACAPSRRSRALERERFALRRVMVTASGPLRCAEEARDSWVIIHDHIGRPKDASRIPSVGLVLCALGGCKLLRRRQVALAVHAHRRDRGRSPSRTPWCSSRADKFGVARVNEIPVPPRRGVVKHIGKTIIPG